jgi:hypothetical protein
LLTGLAIVRGLEIWRNMNITASTGSQELRYYNPKYIVIPTKRGVLYQDLIKGFDDIFRATDYANENKDMDMLPLIIFGQVINLKEQNEPAQETNR